MPRGNSCREKAPYRACKESIRRRSRSCSLSEQNKASIRHRSRDCKMNARLQCQISANCWIKSIINLYKSNSRMKR